MPGRRDPGGLAGRRAARRCRRGCAPWRSRRGRRRVRPRRSRVRIPCSSRSPSTCPWLQRTAVVGLLPMDGLRERKKAATRQTISDTATRLFEQHGFEQVTLSEIATAADVAPKTIWNYFGSKEEL